MTSNDGLIRLTIDGQGLLGGAVGIHVAREAPERVERLVLAATSPRFGTAETWDERITLVRSGGMEAVADAVLPRWFTPAFGDVQRFRAMLVSTPPDVYVRYCEILSEYDARGIPNCSPWRSIQVFRRGHGFPGVGCVAQRGGSCVIDSALG